MRELQIFPGHKEAERVLERVFDTRNFQVGRERRREADVEEVEGGACAQRAPRDAIEQTSQRRQGGHIEGMDAEPPTEFDAIGREDLELVVDDVVACV